MQIRRLAARIDADLVYVNGPRLLPAAALAGLTPGVLFHAHSYLGAGAVRRLAGVSLQKMRARIVGQCEFVAEPWRRYVGGDRVSVIYNGVAGPAQAIHRSAGGAPRVGCIGRIAPEKGQMEFVSAAARIHEALPACRFAIFGAPLFADTAAMDYEARVRKTAATLPLEFAGWIDDVYHAMAHLDLLLVPSTGVEATTRVILEAFAAGLPVIAFRSGGISEVIDHGVNGLMAGSTAEMAQQSIALLQADSQRRSAMARAARETWERRFTLERYQEQMLRACGG
jgi:glycosyltransferase involved in cell wall biosynthesis